MIDKKKFRASKEWKEFRYIMRERQRIDPVTKQKLTKMANLHHLDMNDEHYDDLSNVDNFVFLNQKTHECVHFLFSETHPTQWRDRIRALAAICQKMELLIQQTGD